MHIHANEDSNNMHDIIRQISKYLRPGSIYIKIFTLKLKVTNIRLKTKINLRICFKYKRS